MSTSKSNVNYLLTVDELAAALRVKKSWVYGATHYGKIPVIKVGKYSRYVLPHVLEALGNQFNTTGGGEDE